MAVQFRFFVVFVAAFTAIRSTESYITCPKCTHAGNVIQCFLNNQICAGGQVCVGTMSDLGVSVECGFRQNCELTVLEESGRCTSGLPFSLHDECHFCCSDFEDCRKQMALVQEGINGASDILHCPTCPAGTTDPHDCFLNLQPCDPAVKMCSVEWTGGTVTGGCEKNSVLCRLHESQSLAYCGQDSIQHKSFCTRCCNTSQCLVEAFHVDLTATALPVSDVTTTTTFKETTTTVYVRTTTDPNQASCVGSHIVPTTTPTTTARTTTARTTTPTTTTSVPTTTTTPTTTTSVPTTTTTPTTTTSAPTTTTTPTTTTSVPTTTTETTTLVTRGQCKDSSAVDCSVPDLCAVELGRVYCPHTCNTCDTTGTTLLPVTSTCEDSLVGQVFSCRSLPDVCSQVYAHTLCPRTCGFCVEDGGKIIDLLG